MGMGATMGLVLCMYALAFWYAYSLVENGEMTAGKVLNVYFSIIIGAMAIGQAAPSIAAFADGKCSRFPMPSARRVCLLHISLMLAPPCHQRDDFGS